jgi:hypothetical protein
MGENSLVLQKALKEKVILGNTRILYYTTFTDCDADSVRYQQPMKEIILGYH